MGPPNVPVLIPKQFSDFDKILNKYKKTPFTIKMRKSKKCIFKGRKSGKLIFFLFLNLPNVPVLIPKQFSDFEKIKKSKKESFYTKNWKKKKNPKKCIFKGR